MTGSISVMNLPANVCEEMGLRNAGYYMDDCIVLGVFDDWIWRECVLLHELGHHLYGNCERTAWLYALRVSSVALPFFYKRRMVECINSYKRK
jgi:hypothetical protein